MNTPILLQIPEACHQNWNEMTATSNGRFCDSCQKTVVDFTSMTDQQVLNFFKNKAGQDTCGRFTEDQLAQQYREAPKPKANWYKWIAACIASGMFGNLKVHAQPKADTVQQCTKDQKVKGEVKTTSTDAAFTEKEPVQVRLGGIRAIEPTFIVKGKVTDDKKQPVPFSSLTIHGAGRGIAADQYGNFILSLGKHLNDQKIIN